MKIGLLYCTDMRDFCTSNNSALYIAKYHNIYSAEMIIVVSCIWLALFLRIRNERDERQVRK